MYQDEYDPSNETFVEFLVREKAHYYNPFQKSGTRRFTSLERHRLVFEIILAKHNENGAYLPGIALRTAAGCHLMAVYRIRRQDSRGFPDAL